MGDFFKDLTIEVLRNPGELPVDLVELRKRVYVAETGFFEEGSVTSGGDLVGSHVVLRHGGRVVGAAHAVEACLTDFATHTGVTDLEGVGYTSKFMVAPEFRGAAPGKIIIYAILSEFRLMGLRSFVLYHVEGGYSTAGSTGVVPIHGAALRKVEGRAGKKYSLSAHGQEVDYAMFTCWNSMDAATREWVADEVIYPEIMETENRIFDKFHSHEWFRLATAGELTIDQYRQTMAGWYQFVKWTTRLLASVIAVTEDSALRRHYLKHLSGEIDHEKLIENDLRHLGGDVDFVKHHLAPSRHIRKFMSVQESIASFHRDPRLFLAVPLTIEGMSGRLSKEIGQGLAACVKKWGFDPAKATTFLSSHVVTDGSEDGHWIQTARMVKKHIRDDDSLRNFLEVAAIVDEAISGALSDYLDSAKWKNVAKPDPQA